MGVRDGRPAPAAAARLAARDHEGGRRRHRGGQPCARRVEACQRQASDNGRRQDAGGRIERRLHDAAMTRRRAAATLAVSLFVSAAAISSSARSVFEKQEHAPSSTLLGRAPSAQRRGGAPPGPAKPTPHWPDGRVNLGPPPGDTGIWTPPGIVQLSVNPKSVNRANPASHLPNNITLEAVPFQPWARALHAARQANFERDEPHTRCKASGGPREFITPYGVEFVDMPETRRIYIFDVGGPHTFRTIYMDGRPHPKDLDPSYYGHSAGRWEGESLVVDTVGYNTKFWMDREGTPHSQQLPLREAFTRPDLSPLQYEATGDH